jgi:hypothetical protein
LPVCVRDFSARARLHLLARHRRPRCAELHPLRERGDLRVLQLLTLRRHLEFRVLVVDRLDEQALRWITGDDGRSRVAARDQRVARIHEEITLHLFAVAVALEAVLREDRLHLFAEKDVALALGCTRGGDGDQEAGGRKKTHG